MNLQGKISFTHLLAWPLYLAIWFILRIIDFNLRDSEHLLFGGMNQNLMFGLSVISFANFIVMILMGTESFFGCRTRAAILAIHSAACLLTTLILNIFYALNYLGDTL